MMLLMRHRGVAVRRVVARCAAAILVAASLSLGAAIPVDAGIGATWDNFRDPAWIQAQQAEGDRS